jgi:cell division protein FtsL
MSTYKRRSNQYKKILAHTVIRPEKALYINTILISAVLFALIAHALFINHLNTVNFKLQDVAQEESSLAIRNRELESRISELQTLSTIEQRAQEMGMVAVSQYTFLSSSKPVFAQR